MRCSFYLAMIRLKIEEETSRRSNANPVRKPLEDDDENEYETRGELCTTPIRQHVRHAHTLHLAAQTIPRWQIVRISFTSNSDARWPNELKNTLPCPCCRFHTTGIFAPASQKACSPEKVVVASTWLFGSTCI